MRGTDFLNMMEYIDADLIVEAELYPDTDIRVTEFSSAGAAKRRLQRKKRRSRLFAAAASLFLLLGGAYAARVGAFGFFRASSSGNGGGAAGDGLTFMSYAGPVFPMTLLTPSDALSAERNITFDFSPYITHTQEQEFEGEVFRDEISESKALVTDTYLLLNSADSAQTVTAVYPVAANFLDDIRTLPTITVDSAAVEASLLCGPYTGGFCGAGGETHATDTLNLDSIHTWTDYEKLLDAGYEKAAFDSESRNDKISGQLSQLVTVYELSGISAPEDADATAPSLNMEFTMDYSKTRLLSYGMNGGSDTPGTGLCSRMLFVPRKGGIHYGKPAYLIVFGEDIGDYTLTGYRNGACEAGNELEGVTAAVTRYQVPFREIFERLALDHLNYCENSDDILQGVDSSFFISAAAELLCTYGMLSDSPAMRYDFGLMEEMFQDAAAMDRIMYLSFPVTVPAGGSVEITASTEKAASFDFGGGRAGKNKLHDGYDLATTLGSTLAFTLQTASILHTEEIEILDQNFGFDPASGITAVTLDPSVGRYYLNIIKKQPDTE